MKKSSLLTAGALGLLLAGTSAYAQTYGERVDVTAPRMHFIDRDNALGVPTQNVSMSENVSYRDLNLRTASGARRLQERVRFAAQSVCNRLDRLYPISEDSTPSCIQGAVASGSERADAAIEHVRYVAYLEDRHRMAMLERDKKPVKHVASRETNTKSMKNQKTAKKA